MNATYQITLSGTNFKGEAVTDELTAGSWEDAIREAWNLLGPTGANWDDAVVREQYAPGAFGPTVRLTTADKAAHWEALAARARRTEAESASGVLTPLFDE